MQRVRIGLTGLGFVFVAVLLATALTGRPDDERPITSNTVAGVIEPVNQIVPPRQEPLAELGVAPRDTQSNSALATGNAAAPGAF